MNLKEIFNNWALRTERKYASQQWLLSNWEVLEGVQWPEKKIEIMLQDISEALFLTKDTHLIDLGCGGGWILKGLSSHYKRGVGLDISLEMLAHAQKTCPHNGLLCGSIDRLPFKDEMFDRILSYFVFINFPDDLFAERCISEIIRVLKKGGRALIGQLPDQARSADYDAAKQTYMDYCRQTFQLGRDNREIFRPPIKLYDRQQLGRYLKEQHITFQLKDSFNPFFRGGQEKTVPWRFDLILQKP